MKKTIFIIPAVCVLMAAVVSAAELEIDTDSPFLDRQYSKTISMDFQNAPLVDVLKIFSEQTDFNLITTESIAGKRVTMYLEKVPVYEALEQLLTANNLTYEMKAGSDIFIVKPVTKPNEELMTRVYPLKNASVTASKIKKTLKIKDDDDEELFTDVDDSSNGLLTAVEAILTEQGKIVEDPRTNSLIVTDIASNFPNIENTIAKLDVPVPLILIEVEMLEVTKSTVDHLGIKFGQTPAVFTGGQRALIYPFDQNDVLRKGFTFTNEYTQGSLDFSGLTAELEMLRRDTTTKSLARPRILTLNNEPAQIRIATDEAIGLSSENTDTGAGGGSTTQKAERVQTGVFLTVTPQANVDTGEITMAIVPKVIIARTGATFGTTTFLDPEERGTNSILRVISGDTIVIGGLIREDQDKQTTKVPFFGDLPLIGGAFRHKNDDVTERELVVFITPHIISDTPLPSSAQSFQPRLKREQDIPLKRFEQIDDALSSAEQAQR